MPIQTFTIKTYGCQMNVSDSERIASVCQRMGLINNDNTDNTDLLILNTCSVKQAAEDRILGLARYIKSLKLKNPQLIVAITGCMVLRGTGEQQKKWIEKLTKQMPWVDIFIPIKEIQNLAMYLKDKINYKDKDTIAEYFAIPPIYKSGHEAFVPISTGCNHFCTFCIVPFSRGKEIDRDASSILREIKSLVDQGYKDITLLGQIVNRWTNPEITSTIKSFTDLLKEIDKIEGNFWLTFVSSHPNYMTDELIDFMASSKHIRPYLHFALQSGNNSILKKMARRHEIDEFKVICNKLKEKIPFLTLSTDIIVGFPGETDDFFMDTYNVMKEIEFDMAYISEFSPRTGTAAARFTDDVSRIMKSRRKRKLNDEVLAMTARKKNEMMIGNKFQAIVKRLENDKIYARTSNAKDIEIPVSNCKVNIGDFIDVTVSSCNSWGLIGKIE